MTPPCSTWSTPPPQLPATGQKAEGPRQEESFSDPRPLHRAALLAPLAHRKPISCSCCGNRQCPEPGAESRVARIETAWVFHCLRAQGSWAGPVWASGFPKMYHLRSWKEDIFQSLKTCCSPQLIYYQDHGQENSRILIPLVASPCGGWHQGAGSSGPGHPSATIRPSPAPFLSHPLSPSVSSSSNTNCLHGKSPSMTRFSTHKRKLWATDPTS